MKADKELISWIKRRKMGEAAKESERQAMLHSVGFAPGTSLTSLQAFSLMDTVFKEMLLKSDSQPETREEDSQELLWSPRYFAKEMGLEFLTVEQYFEQIERLGLASDEVRRLALEQEKRIASSLLEKKSKAERLLELLIDSPFVLQTELNDLVDPSSIYEFCGLLLERGNEARARLSAVVKYQASNKARTYVRAEWEKHRTAYSNNKSAFARDYVPRVSNEFVDAKGDPLKVTEKTIREVWLSDTPAASKPAG